MQTVDRLHALALREIKTWSDDHRMAWHELAAVLEYERSDSTPDRVHADLYAYQIMRKICSTSSKP